MRLTAILLLAASLHISAKGYSQTITFSGKDVPLEKVFSVIKKQTGYAVFFDYAALKHAHHVSLDVKNVTVEQLLGLCFKDQPFDYTIEGRNILVTLSALPPPAPVPVTGQVKDAEGNPLQGVSIRIKGTSNGALTDEHGRFRLNVEKGAVLDITYIGFKRREVVVTATNAVLNIVLEAAESSVKEVVVVGYGTQRKVNLTGAISTVDAKQIENRPVTNAIAALQGAAAGLTVTRSTGIPGSEGYTLQVRGLTSTNGTTGALVIIDGTPGDIERLNPNDIESVSILKDAAAAAIYGARAAKGVVLVTTKRGRAGKPVLEYTGMYGFQDLINIPEKLPSWEEAEMTQIAQRNAGTGLSFQGGGGREIEWLRDPSLNYLVNNNNALEYNYFDNMNLIDAMLNRYTTSQTHNLSLRGGTDKDRYFFSLGYFNQIGMIKVATDEAERINARLNYERQLSSKFTLGANLAYSRNTTERPSGTLEGHNSMLYNVYQLRATIPVFVPGSKDGYANSRYAEFVEGGSSTTRTDRFSGVFDLKATELVKGLTLRAVYSPRLNVNQEVVISRRVPISNAGGVNAYVRTNQLNKDRGIDLTNNLQLLADYDLSFGKKHVFHLLGGYTYEDSRSDELRTAAKNLSSNDLFTYNLNDPTQLSLSESIGTWALSSLIGRLNYAYDDRYLLELVFRYDGSSKVAPQNRWHGFPAVSAGWRVNNEPWFKNVTSFFDEVKLRASYGRMGNDALGNYDYIPQISKAGGTRFSFGGQPSVSYYQSTLASPDREWEIIETSNLGLDLGFFKQRFSLSADYFIKKNIAMLAPLQVSSIIGVGVPFYNVGDLKTWGWEVTLGWRDMIGKDFGYRINLNVFDAQNEITRYDGAQSIQPGLNSIIEGMPHNAIYGYMADGLFQSDDEVSRHPFQHANTGPGDIRYLDVNGDGQINGGLNRMEDHGDLVYLGNTAPRYSFGINLGFDWKGFDFTAFIQGVGERKIQANLIGVVPFQSSWLQPFANNRDYWTPENRDARYPRLFMGDKQNVNYSSWWMMDAAYIRLKNLQLGYTLPAALTGKAKIERARIFFTGQDIWEVTRMWIPHFDPEVPHQANHRYPFFRNYSLGLNLTF